MRNPADILINLRAVQEGIDDLKTKTFVDYTMYDVELRKCDSMIFYLTEICRGGMHVEELKTDDNMKKFRQFVNLLNDIETDIENEKGYKAKLDEYLLREKRLKDELGIK